ncbi:MAG: MlaD family protein [Chromatiaceae bacterium]
MERHGHAIVAAAFLLLLGCGAVFVAWWMQSGTPQTKTYRILSDSSVAGLSVDARVKYKGVDVGSVREIKLDPGDPRLILIRITLVAEAPVTHATYAEIAKAGLTGASYLALREEEGGAAPLQTSDEDPARIPFHRSLMSKLETSGEQLISEGKDIGKRLNELLDSENRHHVSAMLAHLDKASKRFAAMEQAAMPAIRQLPALTTQANQALAESRTVLKRAAQDAESLRGLSQEIRNATDQIQHHTLPRLDQLLRGLEGRYRPRGRHKGDRRASASRAQPMPGILLAQAEHRRVGRPRDRLRCRQRQGDWATGAHLPRAGPDARCRRRSDGRAKGGGEAQQ